MNFKGTILERAAGPAGAAREAAYSLPFLLALIVCCVTLAVGHEQIDIPAPSGSIDFGETLEILPNGNIVIIDPRFNAPGASNAGRVYVYDGATMALLSTSTGSANQRIGSRGISMLDNGNFLVRSTGMLTWCSAVTGCPSTFSTTNSLTNLTTLVYGDVAFAPITPLSNGNYVVTMREWNNFRGSSTWCSGTAPCTGEISSSNSLVGQNVGDRVGVDGVVPFANGNYLIGTWLSDFRGAITWCSGTSSCVGNITPANSMIGATPSESVSIAGLVQLAGGDYLLRNSGWSGAKGAVTRCPSTGPCTAAISAANSMVGTTDGDQVGAVIVVLSNGNYVVSSQQWNNGAMADAGFVRFCDLAMPCVGPVTSANSLVGPRPNSGVGVFGMIMELTNGNYVVRVPFWSSATTNQVGAVTWCSGTTGCTGEVTEANSLVGSSFDDRTGSNFTALSNGNYVVVTDSWNNGAIQNAGAVTLCSGTGGCTGTVSSSNSLVGTTTNEFVGGGFGSVVALSNGHYVVATAGFDNGPATDAGAVTWCDGTTGCTGTISPANSLVGSTADDMVNSAVALTDGNYVVPTSGWDNGGAADVGAVTWCSGVAGCTGTISSTNSMTGTTTGNYFGIRASPLPGGKYLIESPAWDNGAAADAGAVTVCQAGGVCTGSASPSNSLVGSSANDVIGALETIFLPNGNFVVAAPDWDNGSAVDAGAVTLCTTAPGGCIGAVSAARSLVGSTLNDRIGGEFGDPILVLPNGNYITGNDQWDNAGVVNAGAVTWCSATAGCVGPVSALNSLVGTSQNDRVGNNISSGDDYYINVGSNSNYSVYHENWNNGSIQDVGAVTFCGGNGPCVGAVSSQNSVVGTSEFEGYEFNHAVDVNNQRMVIARWESNVLSLFRPTYRSAADGDWTDASTWDFGAFSHPVDVIIIDPHNVTLNTDLAGINSLYVAAGGALSVNGSRTSAINFTIDGELDLSLPGRFDMQTNTLTIGCGGTTNGASGLTGYVIGNLSRCLTPGSYLFPVGTANGYSPVSSDVLATNGPTSLAVMANQGYHPNAPMGTGPARRFWTLTETGDVSAILTFHYLQTDLPAVPENTFELRRFNGSTFDLVPATLDTDENSATTLGSISDFSDWTLLSPLEPTASRVAISGFVRAADGNPVSRGSVTLTGPDGNAYSAVTNTFGFYRIDMVPAGETYVLSARHGRYSFTDRAIFVTEELTEVNITALP